MLFDFTKKDTYLFPQYSDNDSFRSSLRDTVFGIGYRKPPEDMRHRRIAAGVTILVPDFYYF